jgi:excisionase family DNA binding protein
MARPQPRQSDAFSALLDSIADSIARRVVARVDAYLEARTGQPSQDAYRIEQAATALNLSVSEVRRRVATGELGSRRVGRAVLIPRSAVEQFLADPSADAA